MIFYIPVESISIACIPEILNSLSGGLVRLEGRARLGRRPLGLLLQITALVMQRTMLMRYQTSLLLCAGNGILLVACSTLVLLTLVPEVRSSTGVCAFSGQSFGAVLDV